MREQRGKRGGRHQGPRINEQIRISECRLVSDHGEAFGVVSLSEARNIAQEKGVDLVEIAPTAKPPVVKLIDYGKFKYEQQKKLSEAKKKQVKVQLKEIQFKPNIDVHDLQTKLKRAEKFVGQGDKIKMVMQFRGREMAYRDSGLEKFKGIINMVLEMGAIVESIPKMMGNRIIAIVAPSAKPVLKKADKPVES
ncbi:MAG: translation initiation factor IF-3 [Bacteriovoracaceae bacterium]|nr:translation initiation factor IF-3 [Bacteriovoracaceae bacterium]